METIELFCKNNGKYYNVQPGCSLLEFERIVESDIQREGGAPLCTSGVPIAAYSDNSLKELGFKVYSSQAIEFIDVTGTDGQRVYSRSLCMVVQKCVVDLWGEKPCLRFDYSLPIGLYGEIDGVRLSPEQVAQLKERVAAEIKADSLFEKRKMSAKEASELYTARGQVEKGQLAMQIGKFYVSAYWLNGYCDTFYGPLLYSTGYITNWNIIHCGKGFCLQYPLPSNPEKLPEFVYQEKLHKLFEENRRWLDIVGAHNVPTINNAISNGWSNQVVMISEGLHNRKYGQIADMIHDRRDKVKVVLIAGPSSSGKTTTSMRIALQMKVLGLNPVVIAMDDYFVDREFTPKDEKGDYDFESIYAMDLELLNTQLNQLFNGQEVDMPKYDFAQGKKIFGKNRLKLEENDILVMEGIHALNPELTRSIADERKFKVYASALTTLSIDENNYISTSDNRLLRRIVRDNNFRAYSAEKTILRWKSVRDGEMKNIFPYQENADVMFNSSLVYELSLLKYYAQPQLLKISPLSPAYPEANRLLKFLSYVTEMSPADQAAIPPTSVMREFIGGSSFEY